MSSNVFPAPGAIKSNQRGVATITAGNYTATVTITSVDTTKALESYLGSICQAVPTQSNATVTLTNATTLTVSRPLNTNSTDVSWRVTEYY